MLNIDRVIIGNYICNLAQVDLNRLWIDPNKKLQYITQTKWLKGWNSRENFSYIVTSTGIQERKIVLCMAVQKTTLKNNRFFLQLCEQTVTLSLFETGASWSKKTDREHQE